MHARMQFSERNEEYLRLLYNIDNGITDNKAMHKVESENESRLHMGKLRVENFGTLAWIRCAKSTSLLDYYFERGTHDVQRSYYLSAEKFTKGFVQKAINCHRRLSLTGDVVSGIYCSYSMDTVMYD